MLFVFVMDSCVIKWFSAGDVVADKLLFEFFGWGGLSSVPWVLCLDSAIFYCGVSKVALFCIVCGVVIIVVVDLIYCRPQYVWCVRKVVVVLGAVCVGFFVTFLRVYGIT